MEITNGELTFDSVDRALWRDFLATRAGLRLLPKLLEFSPALLESGDTNAIMVRTGKVSGFQDAARILLSLADEEKLPPASEGSHYPSLDDDSAWEPTDKKPTA